MEGRRRRAGDEGEREKVGQWWERRGADRARALYSRRRQRGLLDRACVISGLGRWAAGVHDPDGSEAMNQIAIFGPVATQI